MTLPSKYSWYFWGSKAGIHFKQTQRFPGFGHSMSCLNSWIEKEILISPSAGAFSRVLVISK